MSNAARMLAMIESTIGMFYVAVLIARLGFALRQPTGPEREQAGG